MFEVIGWLLTHCCSNTPTLYFKNTCNPKISAWFYSERVCFVVWRSEEGWGLLAILLSSVFSDKWWRTCWASLFVVAEHVDCCCTCKGWIFQLWLWCYLCMCFALQGCSWSVIFVDLDAHNRNRQTLCSLLPRESRSHVSPSIYAATKICLQMTVCSHSQRITYSSLVSGPILLSMML